MRVLITGISGYFGYELAHYFKERGHEVFGIDKSACPDLICLEEDLSSLPSCPWNVDAVAHLAGASKLDSSYSEKWYHINNVIATRRLKELYPSTPIFHASTTGIYNENRVIEHKFHYSRTKEMAEEYADFVIRMGTICGTNRKGTCHTLVSLMIHDAITKGKIIVAQGTKYRPLISLDNALLKWYNVITKKETTPTNLIELYETCSTVDDIGIKVQELVKVFFGKDVALERRSNLEGIEKPAPYISSIPPKGIPKWNDRTLLLLIARCIERYIAYSNENW